MGTVNDDAEDTYHELKGHTTKEDVNLTRATRFPGDVFWRLSKYLNGSQGAETQDEPLKQKSKKWPILLVGAVVALGIATIITLSLGAPYLKSKVNVIIPEVDNTFNISDPYIQARILNLPQRDRGLDEDDTQTFENPFLEKTVAGNTFSSAGSGRSAALTLASQFASSDITNKHKELRKSRFSSAVEFELSNSNRYFLCLDEVPTSSYVHLAQHLCGGSTTGTIQTIYGTNSSLVSAANKQAARGIYECTSPTTCTIKACSTCTCTEVISATCVINSVPIARAIRGRYSEEGFLQLFVEQKWGYVCVSDYLAGANLVCDTLSSRTKSGFGRFTEVKEHPCDTAPRTMSHLNIHINCPTSATSLSDCTFENKPCSGIYVWIQCEPFINDLSKLPSLSYTPNSGYVFPPRTSIPAPGCDFETDMCGWNVTTTGHDRWFRRQGTNTSVNTGPSCTDYTPDINRHFLFFDGSSPRVPGTKAEAASPMFNTTGMCLRFKYNVNGDARGILSVVLRTSTGSQTTLTDLTLGSSLNLLWLTVPWTSQIPWLNCSELEFGPFSEKDIYWTADNANHGSLCQRSFPSKQGHWQSAKMQLQSSDNAQVVFIAQRGLGYRSDFAIDDIEIGPCSDTSYATSCNNNDTLCTNSWGCFPPGKDCDNEITCHRTEEKVSMCSTSHSTVHVCADNIKIPSAYKCDGQRSCVETRPFTCNITDESGCSPCESYETSCTNGLCVQSTQLCDGVNNCENWFDERNCPVCGFKCNDTACLPDLFMRCDGNVDCFDGSDESNCYPACADTNDIANCYNDFLLPAVPTTTIEDFNETIPTGPASSGMESDPSGGFKPLIDDSSTYTNPAFKTSVPDQWGYIAFPALPGPGVRCVCFKLAGMKDLVSAAFIQISTRKRFLQNHWTPLKLSTPQDGVYKEIKVQIEIPYLSAHVRVQFALRNALIDDYNMTMAYCSSTPSQPAITAQGFTVPYTTAPCSGSCCDLNFCDFNFTSQDSSSSSMTTSTTTSTCTDNSCSSDPFDDFDLPSDPYTDDLPIYSALPADPFDFNLTTPFPSPLCNTSSSTSNSTTSISQTSCDFTSDTCDWDLTGFFRYSEAYFFERLILTESRDRGRLGIYFNNKILLVSVYSTHFTQEMANAVCKLRGYVTGTAVQAVFGSGTAGCIERLFCPNPLQNFFDCSYERITDAAQCDRSKEVGIYCSNPIITDADLASVLGKAFISTTNERSSSVLRASISTSVQCVEFTYKMPDDGWIYVGGAPSSAFTTFVASPFQTWGSVFTNTTGPGEWHTVQAPISSASQVLLIAQPQSGKIIQITNVTFMTTPCNMAHPYNPKTEVLCANMRQSYPILRRCDGIVDCADGSDEATSLCNKTTLCESTVPDGLPGCQNWTIAGPDPGKPCTGPCSAVNVAAPDGVTGYPFCTTNTSWGRCNTQQMAIKGNAPTGSMCPPSFIYNNVEYVGCTTVDHVRPWCSLHYSYRGVWGDCGGCPMLQTTRKTTTGGTCVFPFIFDGITFYDCTNYGWYVQWCSLTDNYDNDRQFGECARYEPTGCQVRTMGKHTDGSSCVFPFYWNGQDHDQCIADPNNNNLKWCSIDRIYSGRWGYCSGCPNPDPFFVTTIAGYGTRPDRQCAIPFYYNGIWFKDCTTVDNILPWCSLTHNYHVVSGWGICGSYSARPYTRHPVCLDAAKSFEDGTFQGGTQSATHAVKWLHTTNVTKTQVTSPRGGAGKRTMRYLYYADLPEVFNKVVDFSTSESMGSYIYADMSDSSVPAGAYGDIRFGTNMATASCVQFCFHMVGKHVGELHVIINDNRLVGILQGEQVDPLSQTSRAYAHANNWKCVRMEPGGWIYFVTFRAHKGKGAEGDIAIDEVNFFESCHLKTFWCPKGWLSCGDGVCYRESQLCDCQRNCLTNADEAVCPTRPACGSHQFACGQGCCVDMVDKCDGVQDCPNNYDEDPSVCNGNITPPTSTSMGSVIVTSGGEYYPADGKCNGVLDTQSGEDEMNCTCTSTQFNCGTYCIPLSKTCDKVSDCPNNEDELIPCPPCPRDQLTCDDQACVPLSSLCNGTFECADKSDEPAHQCAKDCPFSMTNLPSKYASLVVGTPPTTVAYGGTYQLELTCAGTWWSRRTSYKMRRWLTFECIDSGESLGPDATMDLICIPPVDSKLLPCCTTHFTDPVFFNGNAYVNQPVSLSPFGSAGSRYLKIKGKQVTSLSLWKSGFVSERVPSGVTSAPTGYTFLDKNSLQFRDVFSVLSIDVGSADPEYIFYDQYNKPKFNDKYLENLKNATCPVFPGGCSGSVGSMWDPTYAAVYTFSNLRDTQGNTHSAQLALVTDGTSTVTLFRYATNPGVSSSNELGMLLMTNDFLRPDKMATSGDLTAHGSHGTNGDYLEEVAAFTTKSKPATILDFGSSAGDATVELKTFTGTTITTPAPSGGINVFDYAMTEAALVPAGGRVAFGMAGSTTYETGGCVSSSLPTEQATFTAVNTAFSANSSSGFVHHRFTTNSTELAKLKTEVCAVQTLINCANWNPTLAYVVTYQGIMIDDGDYDLEGFGNTYQMIVVTDGNTTFGIVHYAMMLECEDYTGCIEYGGARLKSGFVRELRPGLANNKTTLFNAQFNKNASTNGAYVVFFDGYPCPVSAVMGNPDNFTVISGYPNPLWTLDSYPFRFLCNDGRGSPFDWKMGVPGPGRVLNPWTITCTAEKQGLAINFNEEIDGFECLKYLYYFGSELGSAILTFTGNYNVQSYSDSVKVKGSSRTAFSVSNTGALSDRTTNVTSLPAASCLPLRGTAQTDLYNLYTLFGVPFSTPQIFFNAFTNGGNTLHAEMLARAKKEICMHKNETVMTCSFNPTRGIVMTVYKSVTTAPATPNIQLTGQIVMVRDSSKDETYTFFIYEEYANSSNSGSSNCTTEIGLLLRTADLFQIPEDPHTKSNFGLTGEFLIETGNESTYYMPENFYSPYPNNILDDAKGNNHATYQLPLGPMNVFDYTFSEVSISDDMAALVFGGTDTDSRCHSLPVTNTDPEVIIMMVNWDVDYRVNVRTFIGDTNDTATVAHFRALVCTKYSGLCPGWQPNRVFTHTVLGIDTDEPYKLSGSWQASIITDGTKSYFVGSYGLDMSYNRQGDCGYRFRGAVVNQKIARYLDTDPTSTTVTALNIWDSQYRTDVGRVGTWAISLDGEPCNVSSWLPPGFAGVNMFPSILDTTESFIQTFTCTGGFGVPFDKTMGLATAGGVKMNNQTITCTPAVQGTTRGFNVTDGFPIDLHRFSCLPFYYCCSEAGTARLPTAELSSNGGYVDRSLSSTLMIKGENFTSVRIYDNGVVSFRQISQYTTSSCFAFMEHQPETVDMAPVFGVLTGNFTSDGGGVFMNQLSSDSNDIYVTEALASMSSLVVQHVAGVSSFSATYALVVTYVDYVPNNMAPQNQSAQLVIVTDGIDTFVIIKFHQYAQSKGPASCPNQLGMLAQSGDFFDIWSMVSNGNTPQDHGNAGNGTYIVQVGKRVANIPPPYFFPFGTANGDEEIDIASMAGEVEVINKTLSPPFSLHAYNYTQLHIFTDGVVAFTFDNLTIPPFDVCSDNSQLTNAPKQTTYFKLFATNLTSIDSYGAIYYRNVAFTSSAATASLLALFGMENVAITTPIRMIVITFHGIRIEGRQQSVSFQLVLLAEDRFITKALFILGPVTEYLHHQCLSSLESVVNRDKNRTVATLTRDTIAGFQKSDRMHGIDAVGHPCPLNSDTSHLSPFNVSHSFSATLAADTNEQYNIGCSNGWVFDYNAGFNSRGGSANPQEVQCPPYVQGETRTLPNITDFVCLQTIYPCCDGSSSPSLDLTQFNNGVMRTSVTMSNGFFWDGTKEDYIIIGQTGFLSVETTVLTKNLQSPKCVNTTDSGMTQYLNYISLFGQEFNYTDAGGIFYQEFSGSASNPSLFSSISSDVATAKGSSFTADHVLLISYLGVKDPGNGKRQNGQVVIAYDGSETYFIMLYDDYSITDSANCTHYIGLRTKSANAMDLDRNTVETNTNHGGRPGVYIWENRRYLTKSEGVGYNLFNFSSPNINEVYKVNNPTSTIMDDTVTKYSIDTLFGSSITTFNTFDFNYTHVAVGQGMIYFADAPTATATFPTGYCIKRNTGYTNMTYIMLMGHDQNPEISPGQLSIKVLQMGDPLLTLFDRYVCPHAGDRYCNTTVGVFASTQGFIVTYHGLTGIDGEKYANTYQAVFGTDGMASFVLFIYSLTTDYAAPDCFPYSGVRPKKHLYRTTIDHIANATFSRQQYFDLPFFTNCPTCPNKTGVYVLSLDGFDCTWDQTLLGNFTAQAGCCGAQVRCTESITITHTCTPAAGAGFGYIHKYSGTDQSPGSDTLQCTPETQGDTLSLTTISGYSPLFPYICLHNFFSTCCHAGSTTNLGTGGFTNGWYTISLSTGILIKGKTHMTAMLSITGFLFFNDTATISPPVGYNFTHLDSRQLLPAFSLFSDNLIFGNGETEADKGRIYAEQLTTVPSEISQSATAVTNPTYALLISVVEAPIGSVGGQRQSGQLAIVTNGTATEAIFKYAKYTSTNTNYKIGAIFHTADILDIKANLAKANRSIVSDTTHHISIGPEITNTEPPNLFPFLSHTKIPFDMPNAANKLLNDDRDIQATLSSAYQVFGQQMTVLSMTDNGYINLGTANSAFPDQFCIPKTGGYTNVAYLMGVNYDFKPEKSTGALYYTETTSSAILAELKTEVCAWKDVFSDCQNKFNPTQTVIVTYAGINAFDQSGYGNTFQLIIVADPTSMMTLGVIKYGVILGYRGDADCEQWRGAKYNSIVKEIGTTSYSHDEIYAAQHYTDANTIGTFVVQMYN